MNILVFIIFLLGAPDILSAYEPYKKDQIGEYYEYDLKDSFSKKSRYKLQKIIKKPFKASYKSVRFVSSGLKKIIKALEAYLSGKESLKNQKNLNKALNNWEGALRYNLGPQQNHSKTGALYIARETWRLLKYSLYWAGFRLPRESKKVLKNMLYGTLGVNLYN